MDWEGLFLTPFKIQFERTKQMFQMSCESDEETVSEEVISSESVAVRTKILDQLTALVNTLTFDEMFQAIFGESFCKENSHDMVSVLKDFENADIVDRLIIERLLVIFSSSSTEKVPVFQNDE